MGKKLLLLETEMRGPGGHYLDNLIESYFFFKDNFEIYALLNKKFDPEGTFIPEKLSIYKILKRNNFERKENKLLHYLFEIISFFKRIIYSIILIPHFILERNFYNYLGIRYLYEGDFENGWKYYEYRGSKLTNTLKNIKEWNGEEIENKNIVVFNEQGLGDTIQFSKYFNPSLIEEYIPADFA